MSSRSGRHHKKKIVIVGLPNTGKSVLFNHLTGEYSVVANFPRTTVEIKKSTCEIQGESYEIIDTPGLHCLHIHSEEELVVRDLLLKEQPDVIIQCVDANQLKQSLTLTVDLLDLRAPMVIALNAIHETARKGIWLDSEALCHRLGVPVVETNIGYDSGFKDLRRAIREARDGIRGVRYGDLLEQGIADLESLLDGKVAYPRKISLLLLLNDPAILDFIQSTLDEETTAKVEEEVRRIHRGFEGNLTRSVVNKRSRWVEEIAAQVTKRLRITPTRVMERFASVSRHPVWGWPILALVMCIMYFLVVGVANRIVASLEALIVGPTVGLVEKVVPAGFWVDLLVGDRGVLTLGLFNAILVVLPILFVFFLVLAAIEDVGYLPNLCVLIRRVLARVGLTGNAAMPLILAFGCKTMATLTVKSLKSAKERNIALFLITFAIPCAGQLGLQISILGQVGFSAFVIVAVVLVGVEFSAGLVLNRSIRQDLAGVYLQELPPIRLPNAKAILQKTYYRVRMFLKEAVPVFVLAALVLFLLDKSGVLSQSKVLLKPLVVVWLGLPTDVVDAVILSLGERAAGAGLLLNMVESGGLNYTQCIVAVALTTMFAPCSANIGALVKQAGVRSALLIVSAIGVSAFFLAGILNWILVLTLGGGIHG